MKGRRGRKKRRKPQPLAKKESCSPSGGRRIIWKSVPPRKGAFPQTPLRTPHTFTQESYFFESFLSLSNLSLDGRTEPGKRDSLEREGGES